MNKIEKFYEAVKKEETLTLATASGNSVTMRLVSPVLYNDSILIFTSSNSKKYMQLKDNPNCCISIGGFFAEATAKFMGPTMSEENRELRKIYSERFPGAFDEGTEFGGRTSDFIIFKPTVLKGWDLEDSIPTFEIALS